MIEKKKKVIFVPAFLPLLRPPASTHKADDPKRETQTGTSYCRLFSFQLSVPLTAEANREKIKYQLYDCFASKNKYSSENWI